MVVSDQPGRLRAGMILAAVGCSQIIGWATTFNAPAILGPEVAGALTIPTWVSFGASSLFLVAMGLISPLVGRFYKRDGAARLMALGSICAFALLVGLGVTSSVIFYFLMWALLGGAGALMLSTSAFTLVTEIFGKQAKQMIAAAMLVSGLASSIGFPVTSWLVHLVGWRGTFFAFAGAHLLICLPLHLALAFRSPAPSAEGKGANTVSQNPEFSKRSADQDRGRFFWLAMAVCLIGFVTWGLAVVIVDLLQRDGLPTESAVALASLIGVLQVGMRALEMVFGKYLKAVTTALWASLVMVLSFLIASFAGSLWAFSAFIFLYGTSGGSMSVARATMPLELFPPETYGQMMARLTLPMNLGFASAPLIFGYLLEHFGANAVYSVSLFLCGLSALSLFRLRRLAAPLWAVSSPR